MPSGSCHALERITWKRFAAGLFEPMGAVVVDGEVLVTCRDRIVRLRDTDANGEADHYESFFPDTDTTASFHSFAFDLQRDAEGYLYYAKSGQYTDNALPIWLRDSLINILYCLTETSFWAQKTPTMPDWVKPADGLFGLNECPRACPQMECLPCSFYGSLPLAYFFPELQLSTIPFGSPMV